MRSKQLTAIGILFVLGMTLSSISTTSAGIIGDDPGPTPDPGETSNNCPLSHIDADVLSKIQSKNPNAANHVSNAPHC